MSKTRPSAPGLLAATTAFLLPVAFNPAAVAAFWSAKTAVLLVAGFAGLPALIGMFRSPSRSEALAATSYLAVAVMATLLASTPVAAAVGLYNWGTGLVFLTACVGLWALGRAVPPDEWSLVTTALLIGIGMSSVIAVLQGLDLVTADSLQAGTRAWGLTGNAGRLATLATGIVALAAFSTRRRPVWIAVAASGASIVQLTGTRAALVVVFVTAFAGAVRARWRCGTLLVVAVVIGTLAGSWIADVGDLSTATERSTASGTALVSGGPSANVRIEVWTYARHAVARKPLLGHGPGQFRSATLQDRTLRVTQFEGGDIYVDAHNIVVEHLVTVGLLGTAALLTWLILVFRRARGPLAWFAAAVLIMAMLQPMDPASTPLLFLALGLASPAVSRSTLPLPSLVLSGVALIAAVALTLGDMQLKRGSVEQDVDAARQADLLLRPWPEPALVLGDIHAVRWRDGDAPVDAALRWHREALRRDPDNPSLLSLLAGLERRTGRLSAAERHYRRALEADPWATQALRPLAEMALERCDYTAARRYAGRALRVRPDEDLEKIVADSRTAGGTGC